MRRTPSSGRAWIADVVCGAIGGYAVLGMYGIAAGAVFMAGTGQVFRARRLRREAQLRELRARYRNPSYRGGIKPTEFA